jgi:hypothetical protein
VTTYRSRGDAGLRAHRGCTPFPAGRPLGVACHWPGTDAKLVGLSESQVASQLRGWQNYHMDVKGWSDIAYGVAISWQGVVWDLRGLDCRTAANGGTQSNADYTACLWILGAGDKPTDAMIQAFRDWRTTRLLRRYPGATAVKTHNDVRAASTECPGAAVTALVRSGTLTSDTPPPPEDTVNAEQDARLKRIEAMLTVPPTEASQAAIGPRVGAIDYRTAQSNANEAKLAAALAALEAKVDAIGSGEGGAVTKADVAELLAPFRSLLPGE